MLIREREQETRGRKRRTGVSTSDDELAILHGDGRDAEDREGLLGELLGRIAMRGVLWGRDMVVVVVVAVLGVVGVAILLLLCVIVWGIMALLSMVWVHDTVLSCIAQDGMLDETQDGQSSGLGGSKIGCEATVDQRERGREDEQVVRGGGREGRKDRE